MIGVFVKDTQGEEEAIGRQRQELEGCSYKPRKARVTESLREAWNGVSLQDSRRNQSP